MKVVSSRSISASLASCIIVWGLSVLAESTSNESRSEELVKWRSWAEISEEMPKELSKPLFFTVSHELNSMSKAMETESFGNASIASRLNNDFLPIRVDKNEYPILAEYLLSYVMVAKQISEWPLNVVVTPLNKPIEGGGYYPPTDDWGSQGLLSVVDRIAEHWGSQKEEVVRKGDESLQEMEYAYGVSASEILYAEGALVALSAENLAFSYDPINAGFGLPPKSVSFSELRLLDLAIAKGGSTVEQLREARDSTLNAILYGAIRDYVRGGFYTATADEAWSIPDFRKSILVQADAIDYLNTFPEYSPIKEEIAQALVDDFRGESGYYSEYVAYSGGEAEVAAANTWSYKELSGTLSKDEFVYFTRAFGILKEGNVSEELDFSGVFKGRNILKPIDRNISDPIVVSAIRKLRSESQKRFPFTQESLSSVSTNSVVVSSLVKSGKSFADEANRLLAAILDTYWDEKQGVLRAAARNGKILPSEASSKGYALLVRAILDVAKQLDRKEYFAKAVEIQKTLDIKFRSETGAYLIAPKGSTEIPQNLNAFIENRAGSANSLSVGNLLSLHQLYPDHGYKTAAGKVIENLPERISYFPEDYSAMVFGILSYESASSPSVSQ